jgi:hypothetical protein
MQVARLESKALSALKTVIARASQRIRRSVLETRYHPVVPPGAHVIPRALDMR